MPDSKDYKSAMEKVSAGQRWKQATLEKMQAETAAQKASRPRRTIPFGRRAIPLATAAAICLLVIPATARSLTSVSGGATAADQASPRVATRQMPENSAAANNGAVPFALAAAPEAAMAEAPQDTAAAPACTTVDADSPEAALPAQALPADEAEGLDAALDQLRDPRRRGRGPHPGGRSGQRPCPGRLLCLCAGWRKRRKLPALSGQPRRMTRATRKQKHPPLAGVA